MEVILNDFSIDSQFTDFEAFIDSLAEKTLPVYNLLKKSKAVLLKSYDSYSRVIFDDTSLYDFLNSREFRGLAEVSKFRSLLNELTEEPYWNDDIKTQSNAEYRCSEYDCKEANCFSEALERDKIIMSFEHNEFSINYVSVSRDNDLYELNNVFDKRSAAETLLEKNLIGFSEYLMLGVRWDKVKFFSSNGRYYADEYDENRITKQDARDVKEKFDEFIDGIKYNKLKTHTIDSFNHKGERYREFRTVLSGDRKFRIFFFYDKSGNIVFLNSLLKTTQDTPNYIKDRTAELIKLYNRLNYSL